MGQEAGGRGGTKKKEKIPHMCESAAQKASRKQIILNSCWIFIDQAKTLEMVLNKGLLTINAYSASLL